MAQFSFTPAQEMAVTERNAAVLVSAAAGSGKTRVLVERLLRRITDPASACELDEFLIITFTKKAAAELRGRIARELTERLAAQPDNRHLARQLSRLAAAQITTIDGFCSELVRAHAFELELAPDFRQLEAEETEQLRASVAASLLDECYQKIAEDEEFQHLTATLGAGRSDKALENALQQVYTSAQCHCFPDAWITRCMQTLSQLNTQDAGQTPWGAQLISDARRVFRGKQLLLRNALGRAQREPLVEARYGPVLRQELDQLEMLCKLDSWDALHNASPSFDKMPPFRQPEKTELQEQIKKLRDACKSAVLRQLAEFSSDSDTVMAELRQTGRALLALFSLVRRFTAAYAQEKRRLRVQDFSDLEHGAVRLLLYEDGTPKPLARELSERYVEIMLDEYQDTNEVQDRLFAAISRAGRNLFLVGDVKQAIYRFRLADPGIFLEKYRRFAPAETAAAGEPRKILLSQNFRSDPGILEAVNAVFSACMSRDVGELDYGPAEMLRPGLERPALPGPVVELHCIDTKPVGETSPAPDKDAVEADFVAGRIRQLLDAQTPVCERGTLRPVRPEDIVILLRSVANTAPVYAAALKAHGIACQSDRESSLLDAPEIEMLCSLLQVIDNPRQDIPLAAVLLSPLIGMPAQTLAQLRTEHRQSDLYGALETSSHPEAQSFLSTLCVLRERAAQLELTELLAEITERLQLEERFLLRPDGERCLQNIHSFFSAAAQFAEGGKKSLPQFLAKLDTLRLEQSGERAEAGCVRLMSIHKSKGLEFPVVVLAGLSRKFNEQEYQQQVLLHPELGAGCNVYDAAGRYRYHSIAKRAIISRLRSERNAEELRVLYVAMTRPQDRLIMTYCGGALDGKLRALAQKLTLPPEPLLAAEAVCPGDWVLEAALLRTEAGALFAAGERPPQTQVSELPWRITYQKVTAEPAAEPLPAVQSAAVEPVDQQELVSALRFSYAHAAATGIPAKVTATQLKGRPLDEEVSDGRPLRSAHTLRRPVFQRERPLSPAERGTATHLAMQYLDFSKTDSVEMLQKELDRLVEQDYLSKQQADAVSPERLFRIFSGPIGQKLRAADRVIREFKFSILTDAALYDPAGAGEQMLLQGVTDCCLIRDGALTVIDFKTDRVAPGQEQAAAERYRGQLEAYSLALSRIFELPVREKLLYFFHTDTPVRLE